jgi:co-chaperonin GroES (HSP10)
MAFLLEALGNYVILKVNQKEKMKGTIHIPDSAVEGNADFAEVMSVGPLCESGLKLGDMVLCPECGDIEWTDEDDDDQKYYLVEESAIAARLKQ